MQLELNEEIYQKLESFAKFLKIGVDNYIATILRDHIISVEKDPLNLIGELEPGEILEIIYKGEK